MVVQDGAVIEQGNLDELMEKNGSFRNLFDQQFKKHETKSEVAE
jgi:ATP-binding cassette subfamily B protein